MSGLLFAVACGWVGGLTVALLVLVALPARSDRERVLNLISLLVLLGTCVALGVLVAVWFLPT